MISHEISHVARRDAFIDRLSLLHRAVFWFSPLSWYLTRCIAELAEEASDEAALAAGADRTRYAETLLGFFAELEATPGRAWWQGVAMATAGQAEKTIGPNSRMERECGHAIEKIGCCVAGDVRGSGGVRGGGFAAGSLQLQIV